MGVANIILAVYLAKYCKLGVMGIAIAGSTVLTLRHTIFVPLYAAHTLNISKWSFIKPVWQGFLPQHSISEPEWSKELMEDYWK